MAAQHPNAEIVWVQVFGLVRGLAEDTYPKGPMYLYGRIYGFYIIRNYDYDPGKYPPEQYIGPFGLECSRLQNPSLIVKAFQDQGPLVMSNCLTRPVELVLLNPKP